APRTAVAWHTPATGDPAVVWQARRLTAEEGRDRVAGPRRARRPDRPPRRRECHGGARPAGPADQTARRARAAGGPVGLVDGGADLLVPGDMGIGNTTPAAVLVAAIADIEPVQVIGRGSGVDDAGWMRKIVAIRDALRRARPVTGDPIGLLATVGGADIAAM